jgi:phage host-nuclease inhibitor protein Gam
MSKKTKTPATLLPVPQNDEEAANAIARIGECEREITRIRDRLSADVDLAKGRASDEASPYQAKVIELTRGLQVYADANRQRLTEGGKTKTVELMTGKMSWRTRPASVKLAGKIDEIVDRIKALNLLQFIRTKEEVNKEAMISNPAIANTIAGVRVASAGEDFIVEPTAIDIPAPKTPLPEVAL